MDNNPNAEEHNSQVDRIYNYLLTGQSLTGLEALNIIGSMCFPKRISDVQKKYNVAVSREWEYVINRQGKKIKVKKYWIPKKITCVQEKIYS